MTNKELITELELAIVALDGYFDEHKTTLNDKYANVEYRMVREAAKAYADIVREVLIKDEEEKKLNESNN